jgi:hypothetical protein
MMLACGGLALMALAGFDSLAPAGLKHDMDRQGHWVTASRSEFRNAYVLLFFLIPALPIQFEVQARRAKRRCESGA